MLCKTLSIVAALLLFAAVANAQTKTTFSIHGCAPPTHPQSSSTITGDFNGDGKPDIATASQQAGAIEICINQGSGNFANTSQVATGSPNQVATADINNDGKLDLLVANGDAPTIS